MHTAHTTTLLRPTGRRTPGPAGGACAPAGTA
ncbi:hypothetical protein STAFG_4768 [Streptomyces afghaniensis 772]|uniref:Uncharacterized protein n=1 Tax=Streptomyces afghaniensis 772 TaxID=1283301 RepID=S4NIC2_9ACTN|nr:hypothetical protein STAFG_4768 [Streptomyces afghaniensis 772]